MLLKNDSLTGRVSIFAEANAQSTMEPMVDSEAGDIASQTQRASQIDEVELDRLCQSLKCAFELDPQSPPVEELYKLSLDQQVSRARYSVCCTSVVCCVLRVYVNMQGY